ncbi:hypothetical protein IWZ00DRAFT_558401 [Phyllosticta capitalensis]
MNRADLGGQKKVSTPWPIPQLVDDAVRQDLSLQRLVKVSSHLTPNLSGPINDIFAYKNFVNHVNDDTGIHKPRISEKGYQDFLDWWVHAAFGTPTEFMEDHPLLEKTTEYTDEHRQSTREAIDSLSTLVVWKFDTFTRDFSYMRTCLPKSTRARAAPLHPLFAKTGHKRAPQVLIHEGFKEFAENLYDEASLEDQLQFSFLFAASIVHELTHCFGGMRRGHTNEEFLHENEPSHEHGFSWEQAVFGGLIMSSNRKLDPTGPLVWHTWADHENRGVSNGYRRMLVPINWIAGWFRTEFWNGEGLNEYPEKTLQFWERSDKRSLMERTKN